MKCKECVFYSGIKCHGQGEFWGECRLIEDFIKFNNIEYDEYDVWSGIRFDDSKCIFNDILKLKKKLKKNITLF